MHDEPVWISSPPSSSVFEDAAFFLSSSDNKTNTLKNLICAIAGQYSRLLLSVVRVESHDDTEQPQLRAGQCFCSYSLQLFLECIREFF